MTDFGKIFTDTEMNIGARVTSDSAQTITADTPTAVTFNEQRYASSIPAAVIHSTVTNNTRLIPPVDGVYQCGGNVRFEASSQGQRKLSLRLNGTITIAEVTDDAPAPGTFTAININCNYRCVVGDYIELVVEQTSSGDLDVLNDPQCSPEFWAQIVDVAGQ